ncbi:MAG: Rieske 2Fe-2S domain-containing protein [Deinococcus sp.]|nr:Rieske 2Fe-2S domain-containing protein [Deinococcus sp.]
MNQAGLEYPPLPRRRFLALGWAIAAAVAALEGTVGVLRSLRPRIKAGSFGGRIAAGRVGDHAVNSISFHREGMFFISRLEEGYLALYNRCTHLGCAVPWVPEEGQFHCPCHGGLYNTRGEVTGGPPPRPLDLFPIEIIDGKLIVDTGRPMQRSRFDESQVTRVPR